MTKRLLVAVAIIFVAGIAAFGLMAWRAEIDPIESGVAQSFDPELVQRGSHLAALGNCITCHTAKGGQPLAGGLPLSTEYGTIHSTNITPDAESGIGRWPEEAFQRAMREGVDREGQHLYPAFPYDHFTLLAEEDNRALYAYLMTRKPVRASPPPNQLRFPFNLRVLIAGWKLLYLDEGPYRANAGQSAEWNRGAYLVEGLSHCGACHTPRNVLGAEKKSVSFSGGTTGGWYAYAINAQSPAPIPWDAESLVWYLRHGWHDLHGVSRGPMAPITANLGAAPEEDVRAIATYVASLMGEATRERREKAALLLAQISGSLPQRLPASSDSQLAPVLESPDDRAGAAIYASACATCHEAGRRLPYGGLHLALSTGVHGPDPQNVINVVLAGLPPAQGERSPLMPGFAGAISEEQLIALLEYLRERFTDKPRWKNVGELVRKTLSGERTFVVRASDGDQFSPAAN